MKVKRFMLGQLLPYSFKSIFHPFIVVLSFYFIFNDCNWIFKKKNAQLKKNMITFS